MNNVKAKPRLSDEDVSTRKSADCELRGKCLDNRDMRKQSLNQFKKDKNHSASEISERRLRAFAERTLNLNLNGSGNLFRKR
jgi:hypothetical protein